MLEIKIKNHHEVARRHSGEVAAFLGSLFTDVEAKVEKEIAKRIEAHLLEEGIEAEIVYTR